MSFLLKRKDLVRFGVQSSLGVGSSLRHHAKMSARSKLHLLLEILELGNIGCSANDNRCCSGRCLVSVYYRWSADLNMNPSIHSKGLYICRTRLVDISASQTPRVVQREVRWHQLGCCCADTLHRDIHLTVIMFYHERFSVQKRKHWRPEIKGQCMRYSILYYSVHRGSATCCFWS